MFVTVTLFNTNLDEENPYINFSGQTERIAAIKAKFGSGSTLPKSAYNPQHPFRIARNYLAIRGTFNYCVFDFGEEFRNGYQRYRFYYIRDALYVNDNVCELIVAEDFWARIPPIGINCLPETFTYKNEEVSKRFYKNVNASEVYKCVNTYAGKIKPFKINGELFCVVFLVISCLGSSESIFSYDESGTTYPFGNFILPAVYNLTKKEMTLLKIFYTNTALQQSRVEVSTLRDFYYFVKNTVDGFSVVSSTIVCSLPFINVTTYTENNETKIEIETKRNAYSLVSNFQELGFNHLFLPIFRFDGVSADGDTYNIPNSAEIQSFFDEYAKMGYKKITFSCGVNSIDIDPLSFASFSSDGAPITDERPFIFKQSLVPPYNVYFGKRAGALQSDFGEILGTLKNGYFNKQLYIITNSLTAGMYNDAYSDFLRSNYNSAITGLSVQQDAAQRELAIKQGAQTEIFKIQAIKKAAFAGAGLLSSNPLTFGLGVGQAADIAASGAQLITEQGANREILSNNQGKERALLELKLADIYNAPDSATFYGAIGDCVENALFPRVLFFENVALNEIKFSHKIYGYTMPKRVENIQQLKSHTRFDYIRANDIIIQGNYPDSMQVLQEVDRLLIEDAFSKGIRFWWTLDGYKDFTLANPED